MEGDHRTINIFFFTSLFFFFFFFILRLLSMLFLCIVLSSQRQQQPLSAIDRMVCRRSHRRASTKLFEKISLVALCICPFDDDTYHLSLARIFSTNVCRTKRSAKTKSIPCFFRCSPLRFDVFIFFPSSCISLVDVAQRLRSTSLHCCLSVRQEHHRREKNKKK